MVVLGKQSPALLMEKLRLGAAQFALITSAGDAARGKKENVFRESDSIKSFYQGRCCLSDDKTSLTD